MKFKVSIVGPEGPSQAYPFLIVRNPSRDRLRYGVSTASLGLDLSLDAVALIELVLVTSPVRNAFHRDPSIDSVLLRAATLCVSLM